MEPVKGFRDIVGKEAIKQEQIRKVIIDSFEKYGFEPAETPIIEYEEFVKGENQSDEAISDIFKLKDRGNRNLALRYEFTFQLKRVSTNKKLPYKRYQVGSVFRDEPTSSNRFRQFTQCDVDIVGSTIKDEAEILSLVTDIFTKLGIKIEILVNNRKLLNELLEKQGIKEKQEVIREIDKLDKLSEKEIKNNLKKFDAESILNILKKDEVYFKKYEAYKEIEELKKYCKNFNVNIKFTPFLARGLSYYNGSIFEIKAKEIKETICAGGSYMVGQNQSTGISFGLDRISIVAKDQIAKMPILIVSINQDKKAIEVAKKLRENNLSCSLFYGKPGKALEYANSKGFEKTILIGEKEVKENKITLKNMVSGKEEKVNLDKLVEKLNH